MLYLTTGANGAGKTLLTLRDVRAKSLAENRPVYHNGRFEVVPGGELQDWKVIDFKDWQTVPDGAIFVIDECHNDMPVRNSKDNAPDAIRMLAEHRRRGFDFYLITQHPQNIDAFVRRLIGAPGWHRHLKRASGAPLVSVLSWASVNPNCEKPGSGASGSTTMVPYPKEVYGWYNSTSLDTAKIKVPFMVKALVAAVLLVPVLGYFGFTKFMGRYEKTPATATGATGPVGQPAAAAAAPVEKKPMTPAEFVATMSPRLEGFAQTAPRYDELTKPTTVPYPAACVSMGGRCECYTQQATKLPVPLALCVQIVKGGFFQDWGQALQQASSGVAPVPDAGARPVSPPSFKPPLLVNKAVQEVRVANSVNPG